MLIDFCFLLILSVLVYSYTNSQDQFTATASAIRQIWSGNCRLSCRHSEHSGLSGLSGLPPRGSLAPPDTQLINMAGPSRRCNCDSCPCALLDNVMRQCRPANYLYDQVIKSIFDFITFILRLLMSAQDYAVRVLECNSECQNRQLTTTYDNYDDPKLSFAKSLKDSLERIKSNTKPQNKAELPKTPATPKREDKTELPIPPATPKRENWVDDEPAKNVGTSKESKGKLTEAQVQKADDSPSDASNDTLENLKKGFCTKCIEKGRTCISQCPRAKK